MSETQGVSEDDLDFGPTLKGLQPGLKVFGRYSLIRQLGRGGMGVVWLGQDEKLEGREVALKFLPDLVHGDQAAINDLKKETMQCLDLTHPSIVRIYDWVEDGTAAAISMEYVDGETLTARRLKQDKEVFEVEEIGEWIGQACGALDYAHGRRIVHRDLKPANLMIDGEGKLRVLDFGIAGSLTESVGRLTSGDEKRSGTLVYMSPQQAMGYSPSVTDDVYALGATIYELLTGRPPFYRGNVQHQIETLEPLGMAERREELGIEGVGEIPRQWEDSVAACLAKNPVERPESAEALWLELSGNKEVLPDPPPSGVPVKKALVWTVVAMVVLVFVGMVLKKRGGELDAENHKQYAGAGNEKSSPVISLPPRAKPPVKPPVKPAFLEISSEPAGAKILIGGEEVGTTVGSGRLKKELTEGKYQLEARYNAWPSQKKEVEAVVGRTEEVVFVFEPVEVEVLSDPVGAEVKEIGSGKVLGVTPLNGLKALQPGEMKWELSLAGYEKTEHRVMLKPGRNAAVRVTMKRLAPKLMPVLPKAPQELATERLGAATKEGPFINSLGMEFIPVPGKADILMCRHETRVRDFRAYTEATGYVQQGGADVVKYVKSGRANMTKWVLDRGASWKNPGFEQSEDHPVVCVSWNEAKEFCDWLTGQNPGFTYHLPRDSEWSAAVGLTGVYPWGSEWPAPRGAGNYAGSECWEGAPGKEWPTAYNYNDGAARTQRVGGYQMNPAGFYDLGGNVWEWCEDWYQNEMNDEDVRADLKKRGFDDGGGRQSRVLRGGAWQNDDPSTIRSSRRRYMLPSDRRDFLGFRIIVEGTGEKGMEGSPKVSDFYRHLAKVWLASGIADEKGFLFPPGNSPDGTENFEWGSEKPHYRAVIGYEVDFYTRHQRRLNEQNYPGKASALRGLLEDLYLGGAGTMMSGGSGAGVQRQYIEPHIEWEIRRVLGDLPSNEMPEGLNINRVILDANLECYNNRGDVGESGGLGKAKFYQDTDGTLNKIYRSLIGLKSFLEPRRYNLLVSDFGNYFDFAGLDSSESASLNSHLMGVVEAYLRLSDSNNSEQGMKVLLGLFEQPCSYFGKSMSRQDISQDVAEYNKEWPIRKSELYGGVRIELLSENKWELQFPMRFTKQKGVSSSGEKNSLKLVSSMVVVRTGNGFLIQELGSN